MYVCMYVCMYVFIYLTFCNCIFHPMHLHLHIYAQIEQLKQTRMSNEEAGLRLFKNSAPLTTMDVGRAQSKGYVSEYTVPGYIRLECNLSVCSEN